MASQPLKSRFWTSEEDTKLIESLLDLYHDGKFYADNNFKSGYLRAFQTTLETKLSGCGIRAKPHIESRIKTLKMQFRTIHEMLTGPNCSGFSWDLKKKIVTAEKAVWDAYVLSYKETTNFKNKAFPYYKDLCLIYGKDHLTEKKNTEALADVIEELERTETNNKAQGENLNVENVGDDVDGSVSFLLASRKRPKTSNSLSRRRRRNEDSEELGELKELTTLIVAQMKDSSNVVRRAMGQEINEKQVGLSEELKKISGLTTVERLKATTQIARDSTVLNAFYSLCDEDKETWIKLFLDGEIQLILRCYGLLMSSSTHLST